MWFFFNVGQLLASVEENDISPRFVLSNVNEYSISHLSFVKN
jgi:hypothetical protein